MRNGFVVAVPFLLGNTSFYLDVSVTIVTLSTPLRSFRRGWRICAYVVHVQHCLRRSNGTL